MNPLIYTKNRKSWHDGRTVSDDYYKALVTINFTRYNTNVKLMNKSPRSYNLNRNNIFEYLPRLNESLQAFLYFQHLL